MRSSVVKSGSQKNTPESESYERRMRFHVMPFLYKTSYGSHKKTMEEMLSSFNNIHMLDISCGSGICGKIIDNSNAVTGIDISFPMLKSALYSLESEISVFNPVRGDAMKLPFKDGTFGLVTSSLGLHFMSDMNKAIKEVFRVMRSGALFVCSVPVMESGIFVDAYWNYYYKKGRFNPPIFEDDIIAACLSIGLKYKQICKKGKLLYFTAEK
ncbi:MAG: class I SAM-dependent methyltransferase [Methanomicrobium sp.]|nr:class I SAM-dependent methyltransferase [Methanomicrobium sp.]